MGLGRSMIVAMAFVLSTAAQAADAPFAGGYAGPEIGAHEQHFYIEQANAQTGQTQGRYYRAWGVGGGAFAGYDLPVALRLRVGVEGGVSLGGRAPVFRQPNGTIYAQHPRWGLRGTGRVGYLIGDRLLAYGTLGYGAHHYRIENGAGIAGAHAWQSSFTIGGGVEYRVSPRIGVRLDFRHLDNSMSHILVGVPIRF